MTPRHCQFYGLRPAAAVLLTVALSAGATVRAMGQGAAQPPSSISQVQAEGMHLLAARAARVALDKLGELDDAELKELRATALADMQQHPAGNKTRSESEERVKALIDSFLRQRLDTQVDQIAATMLADEHMSGQEFRQQLGGSFQSSSTAQLDKTVGTNLDSVFKASRDTAVQAQVALLAHGAFPSQPDVDQADQRGWTDAAVKDLSDGIQKRVLHDVPNRFEETDQQASKIADAIMADVVGQRNLQLGQLQLPPAASLVTSSQMEAGFQKALDDALRNEKQTRTGDRVIYDVLPTVRQGVAARASEEETKRWREFITGYPVSFDTAKLASRISGDLPRLRDPDASKTVLLQEAIDSISHAVVEQYAARAVGAPDLEQFRGRLQASIGSAGADRDKLEGAVKSKLDSALNDARKQVADQQFQTSFPNLASGMWQPDEAPIALNKLSTSDIKTYAQAVAQPRVSTAATPPKEDQLLVETAEQVTDTTRALVNEAHAALDGQLGIVARLSQQLKREIEDAPPELRSSKKSLGRPDDRPGDHELDAGEAKAVGWQEPSRAVADRKYVDLFETTRTEIAKTVVSLLAEAATQTPPKPPVPTAKQESKPEVKPNVNGRPFGIWWVWVLLALVALAIAVLVILRLRRRQRAPRPPAREPRDSTGSVGDDKSGESGDGGENDKPGGGPSRGTIPFEGLVIEVRDLERTLDTVGAVTDLRPVKRGPEYGIYAVGPIKISFVQEGNLPADQPAGPATMHIERLQKRIAGH